MSTETGLIEAPNRLKPVLLVLAATQVSREWRPLSTIGGRWLGVLTSLDFAHGESGRFYQRVIFGGTEVRGHQLLI